MKEYLKPYVYKQWERKSDHVLFVERAGELLYVARLRCRAPEPQGNRVLNGREFHAVDPKPGDLSMGRMKRW